MKQLILALDILQAEKALEVARSVEKYIDRIKVNYPLVLSAGVAIIRQLSKIKPVIADFKIADIPYTSALIAKIAFENDAESVIVHGFVGSDTLREVCRVAEGAWGKSLCCNRAQQSRRGGVHECCFTENCREGKGGWLPWPHCTINKDW